MIMLSSARPGISLAFFRIPAAGISPVTESPLNTEYIGCPAHERRNNAKDDVKDTGEFLVLPELRDISSGVL